MNLLALVFCAVYFPMQDTTPRQNNPTTAAPKDDAGYRTELTSSKKGVEIFEAVDLILPKTVDEAIALALKMHPDIQLAEAELRVAEAKLAQARLIVTQKVTQDFHRLKDAQAGLTKAESAFARMQEKIKQGVAPVGLAAESNDQLLQAKSQVAQLTNVWKLVFQHGGMAGRCTDCHQGLGSHQDKTRWLFQSIVKPDRLDNAPIEAGRFRVATLFNVSNAPAPIMEQLIANLDKNISIEKQSKLELSQAFARLSKEAGLNLRVKLPVTENKEVYRNITRLELDAAELPLHTWLQLIVDEMNNIQSQESTLKNEKARRYDLYVREYGLLLTSSDLAPPDAKTVQEVWKQVRLEKATREADEKLKQRETDERRKRDEATTAPRK